MTLREKIHALKSDIRMAVNRAQLPPEIAETALEAIRAEILQAMLYQVTQEIIEKGEVKDDHADLQPEPDPDDDDTGDCPL